MSGREFATPGVAISSSCAAAAGEARGAPRVVYRPMAATRTVTVPEDGPVAARSELLPAHEEPARIRCAPASWHRGPKRRAGPTPKVARCAAEAARKRPAAPVRRPPRCAKLAR